MNAWNICLTHDPSYGGLYRAVNDFAALLPAATLSFDDGRRDRSDLTRLDKANRIASGHGALTRDCIVMRKAVAHQAEAVVCGADLLIVHSMFRGHASWAAAWARRHGASFWAVPHACLDSYGMSQKRAAKTLWLALYGGDYLGKADRIIFATRREWDKASPWLTRCGGRQRAAVVHWPVPIPALAKQDGIRSEWRMRLGIPSHAAVMLFVGRLHTIKRPKETIAAFCRVATNEDHLVMVGMDGDLTRKHLAASVPENRRRHVHFMGNLFGDELRAAWLSVDAFVSLSFQENFGYSAAEAMSYGIPVILSQGHDLAYEMPQGPNGRLACGWLLKDTSIDTAAQSMADCLSKIRTNAATTRDMGALGRRWVSEELDPSRFSEQLRQMAGA